MITSGLTYRVLLVQYKKDDNGGFSLDPDEVNKLGGEETMSLNLALLGYLTHGNYGEGARVEPMMRESTRKIQREDGVVGYFRSNGLIER